MSGEGWQQADRRAVGLFVERYGEAAGLEGLVRRFAGLPYENLSKILVLAGGRPSPRLPLQVMREHLEHGVGGTCFSLTELLRHLVTARGLQSYPVLAHMRHGLNIHCALRVDAGGRRYLVDPGYLVPEPLALDELDRRGPWPAGQVRLVRAGTLPGAPDGLPGDYDLFTMEPDEPRWRYRFADRAASPAAFARHWLESFAQPGMRSLLVTRRDAEQGRLYLHNHKLRIFGPDGKTSRNVRATLEQTVSELFGIDPRVASAARTALQRQRGENGA